jgi:hypothetical protein
VLVSVVLITTTRAKKPAHAVALEEVAD